MYKCLICQCPFETEVYLGVHMVISHFNIKYYNCTACKKIFTTEKLFIKHKDKYHKKSKAFQNVVKNAFLTIECQQCGDGFANKEIFDSHTKDHLADLEQDKKLCYVCKICNNIYKKESTLIKHEREHINNKIYKCTSCNSRHTTLTGLKIHMKRKHAQNIVK